MSAIRLAPWPEERVELKGLKRTDGPEGNGFEANVYIDGKLAGELYDEGWGGELQATDAHGVEPGSLIRRLSELAAMARPTEPVFGIGETMQPDWEAFACRCVDFAFQYRELDKALKSKALWVNKNNELVESPPLPADEVARLERDPDYARRNCPSPSGIILNILPLQEARRLFVRATLFGDDLTQPDPYKSLSQNNDKPRHPDPDHAP